ncbi:MAG: hypothetical protein CVU40_16930 [Chloroflexi bacterium HGW-Chloroflexi-2]|nr:MAG: hypothetical protein CVU40_16930 [Chloroflexi bacterium HGW-Chloroflexi-2]
MIMIKKLERDKKEMKTKAIYIALIFVLAISTVAMAASVEPTLYTDWKSGDAAFECGQVEGCDSDFHFKFDNWGDVTYDGPYTVDGGNVITISNDDGYSFDWTSKWPVACVIVKGSNAANVYCYDEPVFSDTGMFAPTKYDKDGNPDGTYAISHATFCYNEPGMCYEEETAWAEGARYVKKGNWAMYVDYDDVEKTVELIADYTNYVHAGTVTFSAPVDGYVTITVNLTGGAIFYYDLNDPLFDDNLKVQDYAKAPTKTPSPGLFAWKTHIETGAITGSIVVPVNNFYGVHMDIALPVPCGE